MIFIPAIRVGSGTPCIEKTGEGTLYSTDYEGVIKNSYGAATVELGGFPWLYDDALQGSQTGDIKNGARSARIRDGKIEMQWTAAQGIKTFAFLASRSNFSGDRTGTSPVLSVQKSTDEGANWTTVGTVNLAGVNALTTYSFNVNEDAPVRMRISKTGGDAGKRCNIDDLSISAKEYGCEEIPCEPEDPCDPPPSVPVFDPVTGELICGPVPTVNMGWLWIRQISGNWAPGIAETFAVTASPGSATFTAPATSPVNCLADLDAYLLVKINGGGLFGTIGNGWTVTINFGGATATLVNKSTSSFFTIFDDVFVRCPFVTTNCNLTVAQTPIFGDFGTPNMADTPWTLTWDARPPSGVNSTFSIEVFIYAYAP